MRYQIELLNKAGKWILTDDIHASLAFAVLVRNTLIHVHGVAARIVLS
jgi:hypothetical protein